MYVLVLVSLFVFFRLFSSLELQKKKKSNNQALTLHFYLVNTAKGENH